MAIDPKTVEKVAKLARLELTSDELHRYGLQLGAILDYIAKLETLDVAKLEPLAHAVDTSNVFRDDLPGPSLPRTPCSRTRPKRRGISSSSPRSSNDRRRLHPPGHPLQESHCDAGGRAVLVTPKCDRSKVRAFLSVNSDPRSPRRDTSMRRSPGAGRWVCSRASPSR